MAIINNATSGNDAPPPAPLLETNEFHGFGIGSDRLIGGALSDVFFMSVDGNTDTINGGGGTDRVDYTNSGRGLTIALDNGGTAGSVTSRFLTGFEQSSFGLRPVYETKTVATLTSIEDVVGSAFGDSITGNGAGNMLDGGNGNDTLDGGAGNDFLVGGLGMDTIIGGTGSDTVSYANASIGMHIRLDMPLFSSPGSPVLQGLARQITNPGSEGDLGLVDEDTLSGIENVVGSAFGDIIKSNGALNSIQGGAGDDVLQSFIDGQTDVMNGGTGEDTIDYSAFAQTSGLTINLGQNGATGTAITAGGSVIEDTLTSIENVIGTSHGDRINGNEQSNELNGGGGNDVIFGGGGTDQLWGGSGADRFLFTSVADFPVAGAGTEQIRDFEQGSDLIDLSAIDANVNAAGNQAFTIVDEFTGVAGQLTVTENWMFQLWKGDINGDGEADFAVNVLLDSENGANVPFLTASDFIL